MSNFEESITKHLSSSPPLGHAHLDAKFHQTKEIDIDHIDLDNQGIALKPTNIYRNASVPFLVEHALSKEKGSALTATGALVTRSGAKTGRSPKDKRIVDEPSTSSDVWWGPVNIPLDDHTFMINRERAVDYLNTREHLFVLDGYAGWDPKYRLKIRVICNRAYHALFMRDMLIKPSREELLDFGEPDYIIYNAGQFPANTYTKGMSSSTSVSINFARREMVILGTEYAGEMKKGVFTIMMYLCPKQGILSLHSSANQGKDGSISLFFGLSGTGKTTLSADPHRDLIGDDEHVWSDEGVFNIEGGCYAKTVNLSRENEPEIYDAIRFGAVLENVVYDDHSREVDYRNISITENTRVAYPLEYIPNAKIPAVAGHPNNIIMLTCDAFGVLPPVSLLTNDQAMYHFISGYTAKVAGTEVGVTEPTATFSACFGEPFIVWHPTKYAQLLKEKLQQHGAKAWLVNTGWSGGAYGTGKRMAIKFTRAIIDGIHSGELAKVQMQTLPLFGLQVPTSCPGVPSEVLMPRNTWADKKKFDETLNKLACLFIENFKIYEDKASAEIISGGPNPKEVTQISGLKVKKEG